MELWARVPTGEKNGIPAPDWREQILSTIPDGEWIIIWNSGFPGGMLHKLSDENLVAFDYERTKVRKI